MSPCPFCIVLLGQAKGFRFEGEQRWAVYADPIPDSIYPTTKWVRLPDNFDPAEARL